MLNEWKRECIQKTEEWSFRYPPLTKKCLFGLERKLERTWDRIWWPLSCNLAVIFSFSFFFCWVFISLSLLTPFYPLTFPRTQPTLPPIIPRKRFHSTAFPTLFLCLSLLKLHHHYQFTTTYKNLQNPEYHKIFTDSSYFQICSNSSCCTPNLKIMINPNEITSLTITTLKKPQLIMMGCTSRSDGMRMATGGRKKKSCGWFCCLTRELTRPNSVSFTDFLLIWVDSVNIDRVDPSQLGFRWNGDAGVGIVPVSPVPVMTRPSQLGLGRFGEPCFQRH